MNKIIIYLTMAVTLCSCQVFNKYQSPKIEKNISFRSYEPKDTFSITDISWEEFFSDPYLSSLVKEAILNNHDMLIASEKIKQAEDINGMARAAYFPDIYLTAKFEQNRLSNANPTTGTPEKNNRLAYHAENYSLGIVTSWEVDLWGKLRHESKAKYANMLNSHVGRHLIKTSLISSIVNSYYTLLALDKQLEITKEIIYLMEKNLESVQEMKKAGLVNGAAVEQTKAVLYETMSTLPEIENSIFQLENSICGLLGRNSEYIERSSIDEQSFPDEISIGIPVEMISRRPDIQQAELNLRAAFELTNAARANFYPSIVLSSGTIGYSSINSISEFFSPEKIFLNIIGSLTQPIFNKKKIVTQYNVAKSEQQISLLTFQKKVLEASIEVSNILGDYSSVTKKFYSRNIQIESLNKAVNYTGELMKAGEANYLEVLTAQQGLLKAKLTQTSDQLHRMQTVNNLYHALGGG